MRQHPVRILQVGLGNRGRTWAEIIAGRDDVVHTGIVDVNRAVLETYGSNLSAVPAFTSLDEALRTVACDAVLLVTPPMGRVEQIRRVMDAGLPILAEKPLALDMEEAVESVRLAEEAGLPLMVGLNFRYLPVSRKIRSLVESEAFGTLGFGQFLYQRNRDGRRPGLNKYPLTMQHPMMLEQSIHHLDLLRYCYQREVETVSCRTWNPSWSMYAHDSNVACLLTMEGNIDVTYLGTWTGGWNELQFQWRTDCRAGVIVQRQLFEDLATAETADSDLTPVDLPEVRPFYDDSGALLTAFLDHLRGDGSLECSGRDHLRTLALCHAAIESSETGRHVSMSDFHRRHGVPA